MAAEAAHATPYGYHYHHAYRRGRPSLWGIALWSGIAIVGISWVGASWADRRFDKYLKQQREVERLQSTMPRQVPCSAVATF
jgi:hypothetical protein